MRRTAFLLALLFVLIIPVSAQANSPRAIKAVPSLSFNGETATCSAIVYGRNNTDAIKATVKLWQGSTCLDTWYPVGTGSLNFSTTKSITSGLEYTLTVDATVNGTALSTVSVTRTCP